MGLLFSVEQPDTVSQKLPELRVVTENGVPAQINGAGQKGCFNEDTEIVCQRF